DNLSIRAAEDFRHGGYPGDAAAILRWELDGVEADVQAECERVRELFEGAGATAGGQAQDEAGRTRYWAGHKNGFPAVGRSSH
ncbi:FAD-linked oxidase C-terminal domain-containing protein, partial [Pseudomonas aeruginosa]